MPLEQNRDDASRYDEDWIQKLLFANPEILPTAEIDRAFWPTLPLTRELPTSAGPIDIALISPTGYLTLVETKLWRSPEARRQVVGQIIDYAKELTTWDFDSLSKAVSSSREPATRGKLSDYVLSRDPDVTEQDFVDSVATNLARGRVLLLLVGDGIRESVSDIANYLERFARLEFTLGLVELAIYSRSDGSRLVVPRVVSRTREITRAVIRIERDAGVNVQVDVAPEDSARSGAQRYTLNEADFIAQLDREAGPGAREVVLDILAFMRSAELVPDYRQSSFTARLRNPSGGTSFSLFNVDTNGTIAFGYLRTQLERYRMPLAIQERYAASMAATYGVRLTKWGDPETISFKKYRAQPEAFKRIVSEVIAALHSVEPAEGG